MYWLGMRLVLEDLRARGQVSCVLPRADGGDSAVLVRQGDGSYDVCVRARVSSVTLLAPTKWEDVQSA